MGRRTARQTAALQLIAGGTVYYTLLHESGRTLINDHKGRSIPAVTFRALERAGLIERGAPMSGSHVQAVRLTGTGRNELPRPHIEIIIVRDPDAETFLKYFRDGQEVTAAELGVTEYHVDPGASGADAEWRARMEERAGRASVAAGAELLEQIDVYA